MVLLGSRPPWRLFLGAALGMSACQVYGGDLLDAPPAGSPGMGGGLGGEGGGALSRAGAVTGGTTSSGSGGLASSGGSAGASAGESTGAAGDAGDAGAGGSDGSSSPPTCEGARVSERCVYLGAVGASCEQTCAAHGGVHADTTTAFGTPDQGGTKEACAEALQALGVTAAVNPATRTDGRGLGCHLYDSVPFWLTTPEHSTSVGYVRTRIVCACEQ